MKIIIILISCVLCSIDLQGSTRNDNGFYGRIFSGASGSGEMYVPYFGPDSFWPQAKISDKRSDTSRKTTIQGNKLSLGYYYNYLQAELGYFNSKIEEQSIRDNSGSEIGLNGTLNFYEGKAGLRFSKPGDTSFHWIYMGGRVMNYETNFNNTSARGIGYDLGYLGFFSFGLTNNFETVLLCEFAYGFYKKNNISSTVTINKKMGPMPYYTMSLGAGIQYEPYNVTVIFKINSENNKIAYKSSKDKIAAGAQETLFGFEILYFYNKFKYDTY